MRKWMLFTVAAISGVSLAFAQPAPQAYPVEFGLAHVKLVISGEYLIFVNDSSVENSFVIPRDNVQNMNLEDGMMSVALRQPMRDASGERSRLSFRFANPANADSIVRWSETPKTGRSTTVASSAAEGKIEEHQVSYQVKHNHRIGSCTGRLILTADRLIYESLTEINDSRQWSMKDIKEVEHNSPYKLDVKPFTGNDYSFEFLGKGMDNADYTTLTKQIAAARAAR